jgi:crotonobetainyl-CoA:carnitine CoA-transferase CaiB-like acyl-CoA transferase
MTAVLPLAGVKVCDLSSYASGPMATQIMADLGATVLKIEKPPLGDAERHTDPPMFEAWNRGKYSIALDLARSEDDRRVLRELIAGADVFVEGFRPGAAARLGFDFASVAALQPKIVYLSINAYGSTGPYAKDLGLDMQYQALAGAVSLVRDSNGEPVYPTSMPTFDFAAGCYGVIAVLAALRRPEALPAQLEVPILGAGLNWVFPRVIDAVNTGERIPGADIFKASDGKYVMMLALHPTTRMDNLAKAVGDPSLVERFGRDDAEGRAARLQLREPLAAIIATKPRDEWVRIFREHDVLASPVLDPDEVLADPHINQMGMLHQQPVPHVSLPITGLPTRRVAQSVAIDAHGADIRARGWQAIE